MITLLIQHDALNVAFATVKSTFCLKGNCELAQSHIAGMLRITRNQTNGDQAVCQVLAAGSRPGIGKLSNGKYNHVGIYDGNYDSQSGGITLKSGGYTSKEYDMLPPTAKRELLLSNRKPIGGSGKYESPSKFEKRKIEAL